MANVHPVPQELDTAMNGRLSVNCAIEMTSDYIYVMETNDEHYR
jgi:hypothetical protein